MIDRARVAAGLVVLGGVLAGVSSTMDMYRIEQKGPQESWTFTTSLWGMKAGEEVTGYPDVDTVVSDAWPVLGFAVLMVVAAVLAVVGGKVAPVARLGVLASGGAFFGVVVAFVVGVLYDNELRNGFDAESSFKSEMYVLPGMYVLVPAAVVALVGAVLAQRVEQVLVVESEEEDEEAVVVHQLGDADDDTPPFGLAIPVDELRDAENRRD